MFGTLVICLPSKYEGGKLVVSHNGSRQEFSTAACQPSFAAWYSHVLHEIKGVTSGYRLVLTYNLAQDGTGLRYSASHPGQHYADLIRFSLLRTPLCDLPTLCTITLVSKPSAYNLRSNASSSSLKYFVVMSSICALVEIEAAVRGMTFAMSFGP